jgi:uncharacterized membrane protein
VRVGIGLSHVVDGVLAHWLLGIHPIKLDSSNPLLWDFIWAAFGLVPLIIGWMLLRRLSPRQRGVPAWPSCR